MHSVTNAIKTECNKKERNHNVMMVVYCCIRDDVACMLMKLLLI